MELAFAEEPFSLQQGKDADLLVQRRTTSVLWHKERLLNVGLEHVPADCDFVCWLDADVLFEQEDWISHCIALLNRYPVIQAFLHAIRLPRGADPEDFPGNAIGGTVPYGNLEGQFRTSFAADLSILGHPQRFSSDGYAWCARREVLESAGFYDRCVIGGGTREFALATFYPPSRVPPEHVKVNHRRLREDIFRWGDRVYTTVRGKISFAPLTVHHLWHGDVENRNYVSRHKILERFDFDPRRDVGVDSRGCLEWTTGKTDLIEAVRRHFELRREDG